MDLLSKIVAAFLLVMLMVGCSSPSSSNTSNERNLQDSIIKINIKEGAFSSRFTYIKKDDLLCNLYQDTIKCYKIENGLITEKNKLIEIPFKKYYKHYFRILYTRHDSLLLLCFFRNNAHKVNEYYIDIKNKSVALLDSNLHYPINDKDISFFFKRLIPHDYYNPNKKEFYNFLNFFRMKRFEMNPKRVYFSDYYFYTKKDTVYLYSTFDSVPDMKVYYPDNDSIKLFKVNKTRFLIVKVRVEEVEEEGRTDYLSSRKDVILTFSFYQKDSSGKLKKVKEEVKRILDGARQSNIYKYYKIYRSGFIFFQKGRKIQFFDIGADW